LKFTKYRLAPPDPLAAIRGPTSKGRGREGTGKGGEGKGEEGGREWNGTGEGWKGKGKGKEGKGKEGEGREGGLCSSNISLKKPCLNDPYPWFQGHAIL